MVKTLALLYINRLGQHTQIN